jgi:hypothetical protein
MALKKKNLWIVAGFAAIGLIDCGGSSTTPGVDAPDGSAGSVGGASGSSGGSAGRAGSAGAGGSTGGSVVDGGGPRCGGLLGLTCTTDDFCDFEPNDCGATDMLGTCRKRPQGCLADCPGVCGCDGRFYCNACTAQSVGVDPSSDTSCMDTDAGARGDGGQNAPCQDDNQCQAGLKCCYPCGIPGCMNACIPPTAAGRCPLFP